MATEPAQYNSRRVIPPRNRTAVQRASSSKHAQNPGFGGNLAACSCPLNLRLHITLVGPHGSRKRNRPGTRHRRSGDFQTHAPPPLARSPIASKGSPARGACGPQPIYACTHERGGCSVAIYDKYVRIAEWIECISFDANGCRPAGRAHTTYSLSALRVQRVRRGYRTGVRAPSYVKVPVPSGFPQGSNSTRFVDLLASTKKIL